MEELIKRIKLASAYPTSKRWNSPGLRNIMTLVIEKQGLELSRLIDSKENCRSDCLGDDR